MSPGYANQYRKQLFKPLHLSCVVFLIIFPRTKLMVVDSCVTGHQNQEHISRDLILDFMPIGEFSTGVLLINISLEVCCMKKAPSLWKTDFSALSLNAITIKKFSIFSLVKPFFSSSIPFLLLCLIILSKWTQLRRSCQHLGSCTCKPRRHHKGSNRKFYGDRRTPNRRG